jgi:hypothetical protein
MGEPRRWTAEQILDAARRRRGTLVLATILLLELLMAEAPPS